MDKADPRSAATAEQVEILRRISERGLKLAVAEQHTHFTDVFQHLLDEIARLNGLNGIIYTSLSPALLGDTQTSGIGGSMELDHIEKEPDAPRFLLEYAAGDIDEDDGMTKLDILRMLAAERGLTPQRRPGVDAVFDKEIFLLVPANGHIDEDEGMTLDGIMNMLSNEIRCDLVEIPPEPARAPEPRFVSRRRQR